MTVPLLVLEVVGVMIASLVPVFVTRIGLVKFLGYLDWDARYTALGFPPMSNCGHKSTLGWRSRRHYGAFGGCSASVVK